MRPVSARFLDAVHHSHDMVVEAKVVGPGQTGVDPTGTAIPVLSGDVTSDGSADVRSTLELTTIPDPSVADPLRFPQTPGDLLAPYGNEIFVRRGVRFGDRSIEWVSLGYFRIDSVSQDDPPSGPISIQASDRMAGIVDATMLAPFQFHPAMTVENTFDQLILEVYPGAVIEYDDGGALIGRSTIVEEDRYGFLRDVAAAHAKDFFVDHRGVFVLRDRVDLTSPVFSVSSGRGGVLVEASRETSREGVFNAVVAVGEGADQVDPVYGVAYDLDPSSPTYWNGPFGRVVHRYRSPLLVDPYQAESAARKILADNLGSPFGISFGMVPAPFLEVFDPVEIRTPGDIHRHRIQQISIPLDEDSAVTAVTKNLSGLPAVVQ